MNVMLSRARHGMIIIGDISTFSRCSNRKGRALWRNTIEPYLKENSALHDGFRSVSTWHVCRTGTK